jgi:NADH-quinone oxidoreductase subunit K
MVSLNSYIALSMIVFAIGIFGFLTRRNIIIMFISIELMLNAVNISLVAFSYYLQDIKGHIIVFFIISVAAAEAVIGLAILIALFREKPTVNIDEINIMKW